MSSKKVVTLLKLLQLFLFLILVKCFVRNQKLIFPNYNFHKQNIQMQNVHIAGNKLMNIFYIILANLVYPILLFPFDAFEYKIDGYNTKMELTGFGIFSILF